MVIALFTAAVRLPTTPCIITNTADAKACSPGSCANKTCCATSHKRTALPTQPLAKATADQQSIATLSPAVTIPLAIQAIAEARYYLQIESEAVSPPRLALLCTFLI
jgi:hypothetical protein